MSAPPLWLRASRRAMSKLHRAGYEVHLNFSPAVLRKGPEVAGEALFKELNDILHIAMKDQLPAEIMMLTRDRDLHELNFPWHSKVEKLFWK